MNERVDPHEEEGARRMHHRPLLSREDDQEDVEALERIIQERFARNRTEYDDDDATEVEQQALLPSVRDPKLWMVKCAVCIPDTDRFHSIPLIPFHLYIGIGLFLSLTLSSFHLDWSRERGGCLLNAKVH